MANRNRNDYGDQDYPHYYDRTDRYDSQSERGDFSSGRRNRNEQRNRSGSGRENTQGGAFDYNQSEERSSFSGLNNNNETGYQGNNSETSFGRGSNLNSRSNDDFASTTRSGEGYGNESRRRQRDDRGDYTLYGYDRDPRHADRAGDYGGLGERSSDYSSNYGYSGGSYARSDDDRQSNEGRGGSSRYRGEQGDQENYEQQRNQNLGQSFYGQGGGYTGSSEKGFDYRRSSGAQNRQSNRPQNEQEERGWWERTTDEVASWFGSDDATRRREGDSRESNYSNYQNREQQATSHRGRGPKNYRRTDERIKEDINDRLTDYAYLDASDIDVEVSSGEVVLTGTVESRYAKRMAEDIAENVSGVTHIENRLRVKNQNQSGEQKSDQNQAGFSTANLHDSSGTFGSREDLAANYTNQGLTAASPIGKPALGNLTGSNSAINSDDKDGERLNSETANNANGLGIGANSANQDSESSREDKTFSSFSQKSAD